LSALANALLRWNDKGNEAANGRTCERDQECGNFPGGFSGPCQQPEIGPGIEILFDRKKKNFRGCAPGAELPAIAVAVPANVVKHFPVSRMEADEITATAVVRAEDEFVMCELLESDNNVVLMQAGAIASNGDDFIIAKARQCSDGISKAIPKVSPDLRMNPFAFSRLHRFREEVDVRENVASSEQSRRVEKLSGRSRQAAPGKIKSMRIGEN
jgi:hypothetical protein